MVKASRPLPFIPLWRALHISFEQIRNMRITLAVVFVAQDFKHLLVCYLDKRDIVTLQNLRKELDLATVKHSRFGARYIEPQINKNKVRVVLHP